MKNESAAPALQALCFHEPKVFLSAMNPQLLAVVLASAADVALVVDDGVIQDVSLGNADLCREDFGEAWRGKAWIETVTVESRPKIEEILADPITVKSGPVIAKRPRSHWRQVNHPSSSGLNLPVSYTAIRMTSPNRVLALGRDLRASAAVQQRLVEAHQSLERDYARLRAAESRYKLLFETVSQPLLIVDPVSQIVREANAAAVSAIGGTIPTCVGRGIGELFGSGSARQVQAVVAEALAIGHSQASRLSLRSGVACSASASAFRTEDSTAVIFQIQPELEVRTIGAAPVANVAPRSERLMSLLEDLPDGFLVVGGDLRILAANRAFVELTQLVNEQQLMRLRLADFVCRSATELNVLISNLKSHGVVKNFATVVRDRFGGEEEVEISAVAVQRPEGATASESASLSSSATPAYGFSIRNVARRLRSSTGASKGLPTSVDQLTGLVGRVPMREIVQESTEFIEKLCIEAALQITGDNRASAAEMLGLSRQSLYSKLKRFGFSS